MGCDDRADAEKALIAMPRDGYEVYTPEVRRAFLALRGLTNWQRGLVMCWFCSACHRYVGPGDHCRCSESV